MTRKRVLTGADIDVWRAVAETIADRMPGASLPARPDKPRRVEPMPVVTPRTATAASWSPPPQPRAGATPGDVDRGLRKRLKAGRLPVEATLDLHGFRQSEAHVRLRHFLTQAHRDGFRVVIVVTGKGRNGTEERGVLRRLVPLWLAEPQLAPLIIGFGEASRGHGGEGALYVHLRSRLRRPPA